MTENNNGKNIYWFYAVYASFIPFFGLIFIFQIITKIFGLDVSFLQTLFVPLLLVCILICGFIIKKPYQNMFKKYNWEYNGEKLENKAKNISITNEEIINVFIGYERKHGLAYLITKITNKRIIEYIDVSEKYTLVLQLNYNRVIFLQFLLLTNGKEIHEELLRRNSKKIQERIFGINNMNNKRISFYKVMNV